MSREDDQTHDQAHDQARGEDAAKTAGIPEVDAEIVEEEAPPGDAPFDDIAPRQNAAAARPTLISPGVLVFVAMVIVCIVVGVFWYVTTHSYSNKGAAVTAPREAETETAGEAESAAKLSNNADAKEVLQAAALPSADDQQFPASSRSIANADLPAAAKEALTQSEEGAEIMPVEGAAPSIAFEIEEAPPAEEPSDIAQSQEQVITEPPPSDESVQQADGIEAVETGATEEVAPNDAAVVAAPAPEAEPADTHPLAPGAQDSDTRQRMAAMEAAMQSLQYELDDATGELSQSRGRLGAAQAEIAALRAENTALKEAARRSPAVAGAVALNAIVAAVETGAPFAAELAVLAEATPAPDAIATLRPYAQSGTTPMATIRNEFAAAARAGLASANRETADGIVERYSARIAGLFNIRPASPQPGAHPGAVISRAEYAVDQGDLVAAMTEIETLPPSAKDAMSEWITLARTRTQIDAALGALAAAFAEQAATPESL